MVTFDVARDDAPVLADEPQSAHQTVCCKRLLLTGAGRRDPARTGRGSDYGRRLGRRGVSVSASLYNRCMSARRAANSSPAVPYVPDLRGRLLLGEFLVGTWLTFIDPTATELLAGAGFDFLCADGEHGPVATIDLLGLVIATRAAGVPILCRVGANEPVRIMHALDSGAAGVIVPQVRTVEDAARAVSWCRYPPAGMRGIAPRRTSDYGRHVAEYLATANDGVTCCIQIETRDAIEELDAILAVPGIDALLVGPNDLSASLGHTGDLEHPEVEAAIAHVLARAHSAGIAVGIWTPSTAVTLARRRQGFGFVTMSADYALLATAADEAVRAIHLED